MAPSLAIMSINYDIFPMDVSDLSCGESTGRTAKTLDSRARVPRKERTKKTRRGRRKNHGGSDDDSLDDSCARGADLRLRRASTEDGPLMRRRRPRSPTYAAASASPVPPLRRVSTESAIDFGKLNVAPSLPRRRTSIQLRDKMNAPGMDDTMQTASMTEYYDESTRGDESFGYRTSTLLAFSRSSTIERARPLRRKQTMDSLPSMPSSSRLRAQVLGPHYRGNQSMDSIPVRPTPSSLRPPRATGANKASLGGTRPRSQLTLAEANNAPSFRRNQSMDSLPSIPRRRSSMASTSSRPQSNAVWH